MDAQAFFNAPNPLAYDQHPKNIQATGRDDSSHDNSRASRSGQQKKEAPASSRGKRLSMEGSRSGRRSGQCKPRPNRAKSSSRLAAHPQPHCLSMIKPRQKIARSVLGQTDMRPSSADRCAIKVSPEGTLAGAPEGSPGGSPGLTKSQYPTKTKGLEHDERK